MPHDYDFQLSGQVPVPLSDTPWHTAVRQMTLLHAKPPIAGTWERHQQLRSIWRARLRALRNAGWSYLDMEARGPLNMQYMRNCPPADAYTLPASRPCNRIRVCPYCYGRHILQVCDDFGGAIALLPEKIKFTLVGIAIENHFSVAEDRASVIKKYVAWASTPRKWKTFELMEPFSVGGYVDTVIAPGREPGTLFVRRSGLFLVPSRALEPDLSPLASLSTELKVRTSEVITKSEVAKFIPTLFAYPKGMLLGDADATALAVDLLHATDDARLNMRVGLVLHANLIQKCTKQAQKIDRMKPKK